MMTKIAYCGADALPRIPSIAEGGRLGPRGVALLARVRAAGGRYRLDTNADRLAAPRAIVAQFLTWDLSKPDTVVLLAAGRQYLDMVRRIV